MEYTPAYEMNKVLNEIPDHFWLAFAGELVGVYGPGIFEKFDEGYAIYFHTGTNGWAMALRMACEKVNLVWLWEQWKKFNWWDSDMFDGSLADRIVKNVIEADLGSWAGSGDYYTWLIDKFKED